MKPITKLYLKTFLLTIILYGLIKFIFDLGTGDDFQLWKFLSMTFFFGFAMSLTLVSFHRYRLKKNGIQEITNENVGVNQIENLKSKLNKIELIERLKTDPIIEKMKMTEIENGILLSTGMSWKSWGEKIEIIIKSEEESGFKYQISSSPKLKTTLVDYGKNFENVKRIESLMKNMV